MSEYDVSNDPNAYLGEDEPVDDSGEDSFSGMKINYLNIDGWRYSVEPFGALKQIDLLPKLIAVFGESLGHTGDALFGYGDVVDLVQMGKGFDIFARKLAKVGGSQFICDICSCVTGYNLETGETHRLNPDYINATYSGKLSQLAHIFLFSVQENYGDFFGYALAGEGGIKMKLSEWLSQTLTQVAEQMNTTSG